VAVIDANAHKTITWILLCPSLSRQPHSGFDFELLQGFLNERVWLFTKRCNKIKSDVSTPQHEEPSRRAAMDVTEILPFGGAVAVR